GAAAMRRASAHVANGRIIWHLLYINSVYLPGRLPASSGPSRVRGLEELQTQSATLVPRRGGLERDDTDQPLTVRAIRHPSAIWRGRSARSRWTVSTGVRLRRQAAAGASHTPVLGDV